MVCKLYDLIIATYEILPIESRSNDISGSIGDATDSVCLVFRARVCDHFNRCGPKYLY